MYTPEEINLIVLSSFNLSYSAVKQLTRDFEKSAPAAIKTPADGVYNKVKGKFSSPSYRKELLDELDEKGIKCVTYISDNYPEALKNTDAPPIVLYCKGDLSLLNTKCFSVVGSRHSTPKILAECRKIAGELSCAFTVVSGIAEGADSEALEGALDAGGKVISVLANGFDHTYPACNAQLLKRIEKEGLIITEYPPSVRPQPYNFPVRNRILAGLSRGTLVVSAGKQSGALITADYAAEYGRDVFAFPYSLGVPSGEGCNSLIKNGACLTENILDIFKEYGLDFNKPPEVSLTESEKIVYGLVKAQEEAFLPDVAAKMGKALYEVIPTITSLQIKKLVKSLGGNRYCAL